MLLKAINIWVFWSSILGLNMAIGQSKQEVPVVIWASSPVQPGEIVLVHGGNFGRNPTIELTHMLEKQTVTPVSISESSLTFIYPPTWKPGVISVLIRSGEMESESFQINTPNVWWIQGDRGKGASTRFGNVSLFGNCLSDPKKEKPRISLQKIDGKEPNRMIPLMISKFNRFTVQTQSWEEIQEGTYNVLLYQTGKGDPFLAGRIEISNKKDEFSKEIFNVIDYGAIPSDGIDDTQSILRAIEKLKSNNGGILYFPMGRFQMNETIELPPYSIMKGLGADHSMIYWPDRYEPLDALIRGTHSFEVSDIFLTCSNHLDGIVSNWPESRQLFSSDEQANRMYGNILIKNITLRMLDSEYMGRDLGEFIRRLPPLRFKHALHLGGENIKVTGNNIYIAEGGVFDIYANWSSIYNNVFSRSNVLGWNGFTGSQLIVENNQFRGANCTSFYSLPEGAENIYWGNNFHEQTFDSNNRETITGDLRIIAYQNNIKEITPTSFSTIKGNSKQWVSPSVFNSEIEVNSLRGGADYWKNGAVQIASGKGVGQIKRIKSINGTSIELESAWDILPNEESVLTINSFRRRFIYTENKAFDSGKALQFYGSMIEGIIANNITSRTSGYNGDTNRDMPNWFNQFFDNTIESGLTYRGPRTQIPPLDAHIGLYGIGSSYPVIRSCIIRNNELKSNAKLDVIGNVEDCLFEGNKISNVNEGVTIDSSARNILLRNNVFMGVSMPYNYDLKSIVIQPVEELWSAMDGIVAITGWQSEIDLPVGWKKIREDTMLINSTSDQLVVVWQKVISAFAKRVSGEPVSEKIIEVLLGLKIESPNWQTLHSLLNGNNAGSGLLVLQSLSSRLKLNLKLSLNMGDPSIEGWDLSHPTFDLEPYKKDELEIAVTKPEGKVEMLKIPLSAVVTGDGWDLNFKTDLYDHSGKFIPEEYMISHPFENPLGRRINYSDNIKSSFGYISYEEMLKIPKGELSEVSSKLGALDFSPLKMGVSNYEKLIYGKMTLRLKSPVKVKFQYSKNSLLYVNGEILGVMFGRYHWGFVELHEGENSIEILMCPSEYKDWKVGLPQITWADKSIVIE